MAFYLERGNGDEFAWLDPQVLPDPTDEPAYVAALLDYVTRVDAFIEENMPAILAVVRERWAEAT